MNGERSCRSDSSNRRKLLKSAMSDYIDRIVSGRGLRQRVMTQPRPGPELKVAIGRTVKLNEQISLQHHLKND
jgi:hypothetical protein